MTFDRTWMQSVVTFFGEDATLVSGGVSYLIKAAQTGYSLTESQGDTGKTVEQSISCFFRFTLPDGVNQISYGDKLTQDSLEWTLTGVSTGIPPVLRVEATRKTIIGLGAGRKDK